MRAIEHGSVARMFWHGVRMRGPQVILRQKELGIWRAVTWDELGRAAREVGMGLAALGFEPGEMASICCCPPESCPASCFALSRRIGK